MQNIDNRLKLEQSILDQAEQHLATAARWTDPEKLENQGVLMAQLSEMSVKETREEQMIDALEKLNYLTDLIDFDSGLSSRGKQAMQDIRFRARTA